jgi:pimeloyl-ACP methyl ester carboxylesterase
MATPLRQCCSCTDGTISTNGYRHAADTISRPDLAHGWRFQVPLLLSLGCQVVLPDMLGYGQTSAPDSPVHYSLKNTTNHLAQLIHAVGGSSSSPVLVGAHDWGAMVAWRLVMYYPELVRAVFCFCVPFTPPQPTVEPLEDFVKKNPVFTYQLQNAGSEAEALAGQTPAHLQGFLNAMFGGVTEDGLPGFDPYESAGFAIGGTRDKRPLRYAMLTILGLPIQFMPRSEAKQHQCRNTLAAACMDQ